jgi:hypothetical protein
MDLKTAIINIADENIELKEKVERYEKALKRIMSDGTVTFEQTETIAKRALKEPPFDEER